MSATPSPASIRWRAFQTRSAMPPGNGSAARRRNSASAWRKKIGGNSRMVASERKRHGHKIESGRERQDTSVHLAVESAACQEMLRLMQNYSEAALAHQQRADFRAPGVRDIGVKRAFDARERAWHRWEAHVAKHGCTWPGNPSTTS